MTFKTDVFERIKYWMLECVLVVSSFRSHGSRCPHHIYSLLPGYLRLVRHFIFIALFVKAWRQPKKLLTLVHRHPWRAVEAASSPSSLAGELMTPDTDDDNDDDNDS